MVGGKRVRTDVGARASSFRSVQRDGSQPLAIRVNTVPRCSHHVNRQAYTRLKKAARDQYANRENRGLGAYSVAMDA